MTLEEAVQIRTQIEQRLCDAKSQLSDTDSKRIKISFSAYSGDEVAKKSLDKMNRERAERQTELECIMAALNEAQRRVDEAERDEALAGMAAKAERALEIATKLMERGAKLDAALRVVVEDLARSRPTLTRYMRSAARIQISGS